MTPSRPPSEVPPRRSAPAVRSPPPGCPTARAPLVRAFSVVGWGTGGPPSATSGSFAAGGGRRAEQGDPLLPHRRPLTVQIGRAFQPPPPRPPSAAAVPAAPELLCMPDAARLCRAPCTARCAGVCRGGVEGGERGRLVAAAGWGHQRPPPASLPPESARSFSEQSRVVRRVGACPRSRMTVHESTCHSNAGLRVRTVVWCAGGGPSGTTGAPTHSGRTPHPRLEVRRGARTTGVGRSVAAARPAPSASAQLCYGPGRAGDEFAPLSARATVRGPTTALRGCVQDDGFVQGRAAAAKTRATLHSLWDYFSMLSSTVHDHACVHLPSHATRTQCPTA